MSVALWCCVNCPLLCGFKCLLAFVVMCLISAVWCDDKNQPSCSVKWLLSCAMLSVCCLCGVKYLLSFAVWCQSLLCVDSDQLVILYVDVLS